MKRFTCWILLLELLGMLGLAACAAPDSNEALLDFNDHSSFNGLKLGMTVEGMKQTLGEPDSQNSVNSGMEYSYHSLDLSVSVNSEQVVRRMVSKNADFVVFDIVVGEKLETAADILHENGYTRDAAAGWRFNNNEVQIILLTIDGESIVGFSAEWLQ